MKFFTKYSLFANVLSIVIIILAMLYISYNALDGAKPLKTSQQKNRVELKAYDFTYNKYDVKGNLVTNYFSKELRRYINQDLFMISLTEKSYDDKTGKLQWQVKSKYGYIQQFTGQNLTHLYDGVDAIIYTSNDSSGNQTNEGKNSSLDRIFIKTSEMFYNSGSKDFYNARFTKMYDPETGNNTTGIGVSGNSDSKVIRLGQNVRSYYASS
ncbi:MULTISPECIES: LPS export ABC transporter periplasmic protein LptC [Francisella]|uniref:LPS export ABC transporter periplasmic protein LptC n=2 Tax=Francisella TaxID=262 RepID=A0AAJ4NQA3_9GAMM|nr:MULTISPECIES: LPS export ABC transporter periplasmic protein LptC [Francisella]QEO56872.1 LPS export ABC transporter periplasmic protein LptC [Francisella marina]QEO59009.1 LPS export ABC transporter periplasmic protein LptC [Francisella marina]QWV00175.1 LPS export ABC transporter periplasmic protein LptC [Francisella salimarina]